MVVYGNQISSPMLRHPSPSSLMLDLRQPPGVLGGTGGRRNLGTSGVEPANTPNCFPCFTLPPSVPGFLPVSCRTSLSVTAGLQRHALPHPVGERPYGVETLGWTLTPGECPGPQTPGEYWTPTPRGTPGNPGCRPRGPEWNGRAQTRPKGGHARCSWPPVPVSAPCPWSHARPGAVVTASRRCPPAASLALPLPAAREGGSVGVAPPAPGETCRSPAVPSAYLHLTDDRLQHPCPLSRSSYRPRDRPRWISLSPSFCPSKLPTLILSH